MKQIQIPTFGTLKFIFLFFCTAFFLPQLQAQEAAVYQGQEAQAMQDASSQLELEEVVSSLSKADEFLPKKKIHSIKGKKVEEGNVGSLYTTRKRLLFGALASFLGGIALYAAGAAILFSYSYSYYALGMGLAAFGALAISGAWVLLFLGLGVSIAIKILKKRRIEKELKGSPDDKYDD